MDTVEATPLTQDSLKAIIAANIADLRKKNGMTQQDIIPLMRNFRIVAEDSNTLRMDARICCQNPALNPMQITVAIERYLPELKPDFARFCRNEIYRQDESIFR